MKRFVFANKMLITGLVFTAIYFIGSCTSTQLPTDAKPTCVVTPSVFDGWFESGSVSLDGVVKPANSVLFPDVPNCSFFQWTEQMFLWLTSPTPPSYGGGGGKIFNSPAFYTVSGLVNGVRQFQPNSSGMPKLKLRAAQLGRNGLPVLMEKNTQKMFEVVPTEFSEDGNPLMLDETGEIIEVLEGELRDEKTPVFFGKSGKQIINPRPIISRELKGENLAQRFEFKQVSMLISTNGSLVEPELGQASGDVLMALNGSLVYYTTTVNQVFAYFLTGVKNGAIPSPNNDWQDAQFPTDQSDLNLVTNFAATHGKTIIDPEALAIEVKTSWIEASSVSDPSDYITMKAEIPTYTADAANDVWTESGTKVSTLVMVGIHVVGSTKGHPEMLWATFEHVNNTPNVAYQYRNNGNAIVTDSTDIDDGFWLFCAKNSLGPFNVSHMHYNGSANPHKIETNFQDPPTNSIPFHITPSNTRRGFPWGAPPNNTNLNTAMISINNSIRGMLATGDVRKNYIQTGTTWTKGGQAPTQGNQVGTNKLANSTMETYDIGSNCFDCHTTNKVEVSHIFDALQPLF